VRDDSHQSSYRVASGKKKPHPTQHPSQMMLICTPRAQKKKLHPSWMIAKRLKDRLLKAGFNSALVMNHANEPRETDRHKFQKITSSLKPMSENHHIFSLLKHECFKWSLMDEFSYHQSVNTDFII
jgi:hypothetical protein